MTWPRCVVLCCVVLLPKRSGERGLAPGCPQMISHPAIMSGRDPVCLRLKRTIEYVSECRAALTNEIDGIETEENSSKLKKQCKICYREIPETSVLKHIGDCSFEACTRCWLEVWSRMDGRARCPQCRRKLGLELVHTFEGSDFDDSEW